MIPELIYKIEIFFKGKEVKTYYNSNAVKYKSIIKLGERK